MATNYKHPTERCALCNADSRIAQPHQPWCPRSENPTVDANDTEAFQESIEAHFVNKRLDLYRVEGERLQSQPTLSGSKWDKGYTLDDYVQERDFAHQFNAWETEWLKTHDGYSDADFPVALREAREKIKARYAGTSHGVNGA